MHVYINIKSVEDLTEYIKVYYNWTAWDGLLWSTLRLIWFAKKERKEKKKVISLGFILWPIILHYVV